MAKAKWDKNHEHALLMAEIAYLRSYTTDIIYDAKIIYEVQLKQYGGWPIEKDIASIHNNLKKCAAIKIQLICQTRVYIVTNINAFKLAMFNMDESVVDNLCEKYDMLSDYSNIEEYTEMTHPTFLSTLFVFKGKELVHYSNLSASQLATLMAVFHKENQVNFSGARYDYYGKPRRMAKDRK